MHSEESLRLLDERYRLLAPDLLYSEVGNVLWKRVARKEITREQSIEMVRALELLPLVAFATEPLLAAALEIACRTKRTVYDSVYLSLAAHHDCRLVTADRRFYNALQKFPLKTSVLWAGDV